MLTGADAEWAPVLETSKGPQRAVSQEDLKLAIECHREGKLDEAERLYRLVLREEANQPDAHHNLGLIVRQRRGPAASLPHFETALRADPKQAQYWLSYAEALQAADRLLDSWKLLLEGIRSGLAGPAVAALLQKLQPLPGSETPQASLAELSSAWRSAVLLESRALGMRGEIRRRIEDCKAIGSPDHAAELIEAGQTLHRAADDELAWEAMAAATQLNPKAWQPLWLGSRWVPRVYVSLQESQLWYERLTAGIDRLCTLADPSSQAEVEEACQGLLGGTNFQLAYFGHDEANRQRAFGQLTCRVMERRFPEWSDAPVRSSAARPGQQRRIRIGYASAYFRSHTVMLLFNSWIWRLDRKRFQVHAYLLGGAGDESTKELSRVVDVFRDLRSDQHDLKETIAAIRQDELDILVYPEVGMDSRTACLAALRIAPTQCAAWGHPITTGLPTIDYFLSSDLMEPDDGQLHYSETLVRLPRTSLCYAPPQLASPKSRKELGLPEEGVLYCCCQAIQKYRPEFDHIFPAIARSVPDAHFVFVLQPNHQYANAVFRQRLESAFHAHGLSPTNHLVFLSWLAWLDFLALNRVSDIFLDSIGWSGGNTSLGALAFGCPVVTLPGRLMRSRHSYAFLKVLEVEDGIARDVDDFIARAIEFGRKPALRDRLADRIRRGQERLFQDVGALEALQDFFESCAG